MFLLNVDPAKITVDDLQSLIDNQVIESRDIEYKQTINVGASADEKKKIKLVAGISSFANTDGGDFLVGIRAEGGIPKQITPIERSRVDEIKLAAEQLIQTGISPRITAEIHEIRVLDTYSVLLVRIPKSWGAPHRVTLSGHNNFYGRHSSGMYSMDVDQLRSAFSLLGSLHERVHSIRDQRLDKISSQDPNRLCAAPWIVMHMIPYESIDPAQVFDVRLARPANLNFAPIGRREPREIRFNFDGLLAPIANSEGGRLSSYTQVFRSGIIESVDASLRVAHEAFRRGEPMSVSALHYSSAYLIDQGVCEILSRKMEDDGSSNYTCSDTEASARTR